MRYPGYGAYISLPGSVMEDMSPWDAEWTLRSTSTIELYCPTCGKTVYIDSDDVALGCPVCSNPLVRPTEPASFIDLRGPDPAIVLG